MTQFRSDSPFPEGIPSSSVAASVGLPPGLAEHLTGEVVEGAVHRAVHADQEVGEADAEVDRGGEVARRGRPRGTAPEDLVQVCKEASFMYPNAS